MDFKNPNGNVPEHTWEKISDVKSKMSRKKMRLKMGLKKLWLKLPRNRGNARIPAVLQVTDPTSPDWTSQIAGRK